MALYPSNSLFPEDWIFPLPADEEYYPWRAIAATSLTEIALDDLEIGEEYEIQVRAVTEDGIPSDWSASTWFTTPTDAVPPPVPSHPIVTSKLGVFSIAWDGKTETGGTMPPDFLQLKLWVDGVFVNTIDTNEGEINWVAPEYGLDYRFTFTAIDTSGNESGESEAVIAQVTPLVDADLIGKIVNGSDNVIDGTIGNEQLKAASITTDKLRVGVATNAVPDPTFLNDDLNARRGGVYNWSIYVRGGIHREFRCNQDANSVRFWVIGNRGLSSTATPPAWSKEDTNGWLPVQPGQTWSFEGTFLRNTDDGSSARARWQVNFLDAEGNSVAPAGGVYSGITEVNDNQHKVIQGEKVVPENACWMAVAMVCDGNYASGTATFSYPKVWMKTPSVLIEDGAVTAEKIAALAVTADKIAANAITADKISAGAIDGQVITGATIKSPGRTAPRTGTSGFYLRNDGYLDLMSGGSVVFEASASTGRFLLGNEAGNHLQFDTDTGSLNIQANLLKTDLNTNGGSVQLMSQAPEHIWTTDKIGIFFDRGDGEGATITTTTQGGVVRPGGELELLSNPETGTPSRLSLSSNGFALVGGGTTISANGIRSQGALDIRSGPAGSDFVPALILNVNQARSTIQGDLYNQAAYDNPAGGSTLQVAPDGRIARSSSARKYKTDIRDHEFSGPGILSLTPQSWFVKRDLEANGGNPDGVHRWYGLVAEDVRDAGLDEFVLRGADGDIEDLDYLRMWVALIPEVKKLRDELAAVRAELNELKESA